MYNLGKTRSSNRRDHLLQTPDSFVRTTLPTIDRGAAIVHVSPVVGAGFAQYTVELEIGGTLAPAPHQRFAYVLSGALDLATDTSFHSLAAGGYAYLPPGSQHVITGSERCRVVIIEKEYQSLGRMSLPPLLVGQEQTVASLPLLGDADLQVRHLLPDDPSFDFAVNTMTYQPGASLSMVETHVMEHGLIMLEGGGIYRLSEQWYSVSQGDFIWMAPFCPQWFGALGKRPAKYLIYKDANRPPML